MKNKNGLLPGWPPFNKFKKEMADLVSTVVDEKTKPLSDDLQTVKNSLIAHINKTDAHINKTNAHINKTDAHINKTNAHINKTDANFKTVKEYLSNHVTETDANFKTIKEYLSNHVTETDKKIDKLNTDVSELKSDMKIVKEAVLKKSL